MKEEADEDRQGLTAVVLLTKSAVKEEDLEESKEGEQN